MNKNGTEYEEVEIKVDIEGGDNYCNHCHLDRDNCCDGECEPINVFMTSTTDNTVFKQKAL